MLTELVQNQKLLIYKNNQAIYQKLCNIISNLKIIYQK